MMRSLYSGVAGLKNHQNRMDVVGNNISNVNTTGFKSSRVTFSDTLSQTLSGASSPQGNLGGTNPKQIGLGSSLSAIDTLFTDGSVQSTGVNTDLCLSGNGLFIVNDGNLRYYTRNGNFKFDSQGYYVNSDGMKVSGWMADSDGMINSTALPGEIQIQTGKSMESKVTSVSTYTKNLDASTIGYDIGGVIVKYADGTAETVSNYTPVVKNEGVISLKLSTGETVTLDNTADYSFTADGLVTDTNGKTFYTSTIESVTANSTGKVKLTLGMGNAVTSINGSASVSVSDITSGTF
ncbi:MAG: flagellar hook-basal body complex protein, partial [Anaerovibrio slackiae]|uniref:flagellar hook-basal body complex protein n=1 Tax=Anaerovibrio slackiae TaxID=2652309 RepID=UPI0023EFA0CA